VKGREERGERERRRKRGEGGRERGEGEFESELSNRVLIWDLINQIYIINPFNIICHLPGLPAPHGDLQ
jgi:hypothetical protein